MKETIKSRSLTPAFFGMLAAGMLTFAGTTELQAASHTAGGNKQPAHAAAVTAGTLGDLSAFRKIADDTLGLVQKNDLIAAKTRIKDLETAWDDAEGTLKKLNPENWTSVDKSIDRALAQVRSGKPDAAACETALKTLIAKFDSIGKPAAQ